MLLVRDRNSIWPVKILLHYSLLLGYPHLTYSNSKKLGRLNKNLKVRC